MDNKLTVIIPVHKIGDTEKEYFKKAITSVSEQIELPEKAVSYTHLTLPTIE